MNRFHLFLLGLFVCCSLPVPAQKRERVEDYKISQTEGLNTYIFPERSLPETREKWIHRTEEMIPEILDLMEESGFDVPLTIEFVANRNVMFRKTGLSASGMALPHKQVLYCVLTEHIPLKHELTHMVSMLKWGVPDSTLTWINEGLATYADGLCVTCSLEEIYTYCLQNDRIISIAGLVSDFYKNEETAAYYQSAYLVKSLIDRYGMDRFKQLWQTDMAHFRDIYGSDPETFILRLHNILRYKYPEPLNLDWDSIKKGCY